MILLPNGWSHPQLIHQSSMRGFTDVVFVSRCRSFPKKYSGELGLHKRRIGHMREKLSCRSHRVSSLAFAILLHCTFAARGAVRVQLITKFVHSHFSNDSYGICRRQSSPPSFTWWVSRETQNIMNTQFWDGLESQSGQTQIKKENAMKYCKASAAAAAPPFPACSAERSVEVDCKTGSCARKFGSGRWVLAVARIHPRKEIIARVALAFFRWGLVQSDTRGWLLFIIPP